MTTMEVYTKKESYNIILIMGRWLGWGGCGLWLAELSDLGRHDGEIVRLQGKMKQFFRKDGDLRKRKRMGS
jgi:hypothetical protein